MGIEENKFEGKEEMKKEERCEAINIRKMKEDRRNKKRKQMTWGGGC